MSRPKGSRNKEKEIKDSITTTPVYYDAVGTLDKGQDVEIVVKVQKNPLMGYSMDEIRGFVKEINPTCGFGGCLHLKEFHIMNEKGKLECHLCSCKDFQS